MGGVKSNVLRDITEKVVDERVQGVVGAGLSVDSRALGDSGDCEL